MTHTAQPSAKHPNQSDDETAISHLLDHNLNRYDDLNRPLNEADNRLSDCASLNGHSSLSDYTNLDDCVNDNTNVNSQEPHNATLTAINTPLRVHVERVVRDYFTDLDDEMPTDFYNLILKEVELPLLTVVLEQTRGNQTRCAQILGLNRGTLRKKLKNYGLM